MISHLLINDFATIENLEVDFHRGLNVITGETGAGKSVVISAMSMVLGARADSTYVRTGCDKASIQMLIEMDNKETLLTREIQANGKSLCKIDGQMVTLGELKKFAVKAADIGLDRSLVGAYGQDDKVCAYTAVMAAFEVKDPEYTTFTLLTDKEEIGSEGNTGMASLAMVHLLEDLCENQGVRLRDVYRNSICLSSDVNAAYDPSFPDVFEKANASWLNHGPVLTKYTGARGKSSTNDASAEFVGKVRKIFKENGVTFQTSELGKIDLGGGGTVAKFISYLNIDTVDIGVPVISMHAPYEVIAKVDLYEAYRAFHAFYRF